jgi:multidrug efflux pump subunit AcrA (membrane-fusion protein)
MNINFIKSYAKNKYVVGGVILALIIIFFVSKSKNSASKIESAEVKIANVIEKVGVTGKILTTDKADLAFEKGGVVGAIYIKVGDHVTRGQAIATLDNGSDRAALAGAEATLADMSRTLTPQELAVAEAALSNAKNNAQNASHDAYVKAQSALVNYADIFFSNPQSANPKISIHTPSASAETDINNERVLVSDAMSNWSSTLSTAQVDGSLMMATAQKNLAVVKIFMSDLSLIVNALSPGNSGLTQYQINTDVTAINTGLSTLNLAIDSVTSAKSDLLSAQSNYDLKLSGNSSQSIAALAAKVEQARAILNQDTITSPIDGLVNRVNPNVGEYVAPGVTAFSVISEGSFKIEAYVPEADIAKIAIGNMASTTLDAYGQNTDFPANVTDIDLAETVLEGVPTYKVTLMFVQKDDRIRSGMTANLDILTHKKDGVLSVPTRAIIDNNGNKTVIVLKADGKTFDIVPVTVGLKGSDATIEITSGLKAGQKVVTYIPK